MRKIFITVGIMACLYSGYTQNIPTGTAPTLSQESYLGSYGNPVNFVRTWTARKPNTNPQTTDLQDNNKYQLLSSYFDGLGRPFQQVARASSPDGTKDIVYPRSFDALGREVYQYLPYPDAGNGGEVRLTFLSTQQNYYQTAYNDQRAYSKTNYEASVLSRPLKSMDAGNNWVGSSRGVSKTYEICSSNEVLWWVIGNNNGDIPTIHSSIWYAAGKLLRYVTTDENGKRQIEYTDKEGRLLLKKVEQKSNASDNTPTKTSHTGWLSTYYVYDGFGLLRFVMQPKAVELVIGNGYNVGSVAAELCFQYGYDSRNRMISKRTPGTGWVYMVYDQLDRLVFSQDSKMRSNSQWMYTLYDAVNRPVETGLMTGYSGSQSDLQTFVKTIDAGASSSYSNTGTKVSGSSFSTPTTVTGYSFPTGSTRVPLTLTYYDSYTVGGSSITSKSYTTSYNSLIVPSSTPQYSSVDALPSSASTLTKGRVTVTRVKVLEDPSNLATGNWIEMAMFYDDKGRTIQVVADNYKGGQDISICRYDFTSKVIASYIVHNNPAASVSNFRLLTQFEYNTAGTINKIYKQLNDDISTRRKISESSYNEMGQLINKKMGQKRDASGSIGSDPLHEMDYAYNIRGWLKGLNWNTGTNSPNVNRTTNRWFSMGLSYDWGYSTNQYNGNISGVRWSGAGDGEERSYGFTYDDAGRLLKADFKQNVSNAWSNTKGNLGIDFSVVMGDGINASNTYDANGNVQRMQQWGLLVNQSQQIDNLQYSYTNGTNRLSSVTDQAAAHSSPLGDFKDNSTGTDYSYDDANGNVTADNNKFISNITYNHLNLPTIVTVTGKGTITYIYDATGKKLEKRVNETGQSLKTTTYLSNFIYENNVLQFLGQEEGRVRAISANTGTCGSSTDTYAYDYFITDHLGNIRTVLTDEYRKDCYPMATMEAATISNESTYYTGLTTRVENTNGYPDATTSPNQWAAKLQNTGNKIGPGKVLKVMAGDLIDLQCRSWWEGSGAGTNSSLTSLLGQFLNDNIPGTSGGKLAANPGTGVFAGVISDFITNNNATPTDRPKAYLNWMFLTEQLQPAIGSGAELIGSSSSVKLHDRTGTNALEAKVNGYLYIYTSNESDIPVFFDNLVVSHTRGPLLEESAYYPFGLTMAGISSKALKTNYSENKYKFNGIEFNSDLDINQYDAFVRNYNPQIGRWLQSDPKPSEFESPYAGMGNNPILQTDRLGDTSIVFSRNGIFLRFQDDGKKTFTGRIISGTTTNVTVDVNGTATIVAKTTYSTFELNDGPLVAQAIRNGVIFRMEVITSKIDKFIERSGVRTYEARYHAFSYAKSQGKAGGKMDYAIQGVRAGDLNKHTLYVTGGIGYDIADFGNFLFGRGMSELGVNYATTALGAEYNHIFNSRLRASDATPVFDLGPGTYDPQNPGWFDASSDQRAIENGYFSDPRAAANKRQSEKIMDHIYNNMQHKGL